MCFNTIFTKLHGQDKMVGKDDTTNVKHVVF